MDRNSKVSIEAEADFKEDEDDSIPSNPVKHLKCQCNTQQLRRHQYLPAEVNTMPNAIIAKGMGIFIGNVHLHHDPQIEVEIRIVVAGILEDAEEVEEEDAEVVEGDHSQLEPLWLCRDQKHLDRDKV